MTTTSDVGNPGPGLEQAQTMVGLNRLIGFHPAPPPLITWSRTAIHKQTIKNLHRFPSTQKDYILSQKWLTT